MPLGLLGLKESAQVSPNLEPSMFTLCALFYGGHADLCGLLLDSLVDFGDTAHVSEYRFGLNTVSPATEELVFRFCEQQKQPCRVYVPDRNVGKYPLMSQMFHDPEAPIESDNIMWFDDDSRLNGKFKKVLGKTWELLKSCDMVGHVWTKKFEGNQKSWLRSRSWYSGVPWTKNRKKEEVMEFCTGGWWAIKSSIIRKYGWPDPEIHHNGGDTALGELCHQQGLKIHNYKQGLWINAKPSGGYSNAPRRGTTQSPVGKVWQPGQPVDMSHYQFELQVHTDFTRSKASDIQD